MKKVLVLLLALGLVLGWLPGMTLAAEDEYVYPMDSVEKLEGTIANATNTYVIAKGYHGAVIDLAGLDYDTVVIEKNPGAQTMGYAFLREMPVVGQVPDYAGGYYAVVWDGSQTVSLDIPYDAAYLYIYYNSNETVFLPASVVFKNTKTTEEPELPDEPDEPDYDDPGLSPSSITVATWNIGHFSIGVNPNTKIPDAKFQTSAQEYCSYIYDQVGADLITLNEYSAMFTPSYRARNALFSRYTGAQLEGPQYRYSCNALYSKLPMENLRVCSFECNKTATIQHTSLIKATDYYYLCGEILLDGESVMVVTAHLGFDKMKAPDTVCLNQIDELIRTFEGYDRVLMMGDWNTQEFSYFNRFVEAGYTLGNPDRNCATFAYDSTNRALDNIIVKGLEVSDFRVYPTLLSDHYAVSATISLTYDIPEHTHQYDAVVTPNSCTQPGYTTYTCASCGDSYVDDRTEAAGHVPMEMESEAPSCTDAGSNGGQKCANCGTVLQPPEEIPAVGHSYDRWQETTSGLEERKCTVCGDTQRRRIGEEELLPPLTPGASEPAAAQTQEETAPVKIAEKTPPTDGTVWIFVAAAAIVAVAGGILFFLLRKKKQK